MSQMANKHMKRGSTIAIREMQIKTIYHHTPVRMAGKKKKERNSGNAKCW